MFDPDSIRGRAVNGARAVFEEIRYIFSQAKAPWPMVLFMNLLNIKIEGSALIYLLTSEEWLPH